MHSFKACKQKECMCSVWRALMPWQAGFDENKVSAQSGAMCSCTALKRASKVSVCAVFGAL